MAHGPVICRKDIQWSHKQRDARVLATVIAPKFVCSCRLEAILMC